MNSAQENLAVNTPPSFTLLAPASSYKSLPALKKSGATAVYFGIEGFSLRPPIFELNYRDAELLATEAVSLELETHLALNRNFPNSAYQDVLILLSRLSPLIDVVIISEIGLIPLIRKHFPDLKICASVQMGICNTRFARWIKELGADILVLQRNELDADPFKDARRIVSECNLEVEVFVFGDISTNIDGHCFLSSYLYLDSKTDNDGKTHHFGSANYSGHCYLACKRCFESPTGQSDLKIGNISTLSALPDYLEAGINTFKIQGREFSPELIYRVTEIIRQALDISAQALSSGTGRPDLDQLSCELQKCIDLREIITRTHLKYLKKNGSQHWDKLLSIAERPLDRTISRLFYSGGSAGRAILKRLL